MDNSLSSPAEHTDDPQGRIWTRFPPETFETWVIIKGARKCAVILDESLGGIGITIKMADAVESKVGDKIVILHHDYPTPGRIQWIQRDQEGQKVHLGIRWSS